MIGRRPVIVGLALASVVGWASAGPASPSSAALFAASSVATTSFVADALDPPTALVGVGGAGVTLAWTPTVDLYATGYEVLRGAASGGPYAPVGSTLAAITVFAETPPPADYWYVVRSTYAGWSSADSGEAAVSVLSGPTDPASCGMQAAQAGGDGNGFESASGTACGDDGVFAADVDSGTNTNTGCGNSGKDKHRFWNFGLGVPASVTSIDGIEVAADAHVSVASGVTRLCAQLSWNGGSNWTAARQVNLAASETTLVLGGPLDRWGRSWTPAQLGNANFRVRLISVANNTTRTFYLDDVRVRAYFTR